MTNNYISFYLNVTLICSIQFLSGILFMHCHERGVFLTHLSLSWTKFHYSLFERSALE